MRLLIVEDEAIVAMDLGANLESFGHHVVGIAASGEEAVERAHTSKPDLILMDIRLNGELDGIEAAKQIRSRSLIPIIFITAYADDTAKRRADELEPLGYLLKPVDIVSLQEIMKMAVQAILK